MLKPNYNLEMQIPKKLLKALVPFSGCRATYDSVTVQLVSPAPVLKSATFVGACMLSLEFDETITKVQQDCSDVLDAGSLAKLGTGEFLRYACKLSKFVLNQL